MELEPEWGVIIGIGIGGLLLELYAWAKDARPQIQNRRYGWASVILGLLFIIPFIGLLGLLVGFRGYRKTDAKGLCTAGMIVSSISFAFWLLVVLIGP